MTERYEAYERACEEIRQHNAGLLSDFQEWLVQKGLSEKTVTRHVQNIDFYLNGFLLYEDPQEAAPGVYDVSRFLGFWFIRKALWASEASIRSNAASLKKFYGFMQERGLVTEESVRQLHETIKEGLPDWLARMRRYDDPTITDPEEIWGW